MTSKANAIYISADDHCGVASYGERGTHRTDYDMSKRQVYSQDLFDEKILAFIKTNKEKPFLLYHPSQLPHGPVFILTTIPK